MSVIETIPPQTRTSIGGVRAFFSQHARRAVEWQRRRRIRIQYGRLSDANLCDIGLTPEDMERALSLPLWEDAEQALSSAAAAEAAKW